MNNPFDISFGKKPAETISRFRQTSLIKDTFSAEPVTQQIFLLTGVRGSGKTVLMNTVANMLEESDNWIVVRLNPERDLLHAMGAKLSSVQECAELIRNARLNFSALGFGLEISGALPITDIETAIERLLRELKKRNKRVLVTIDEVTNSEYLRIFCSAFQIFVGEELPVFLLMTGLYENIDALQNEKNLTFLYRAPKLEMDPLNIGMIASRYEAVFSISREEALKLAKLTRGYPFAFQALGYSIWNLGIEKEQYLPEFRQLLEDYVYEKIWSELSQKDRRIAAGIAFCETGKLKQINEYLGLKPDEINQYRKRLIRKGIVDGTQYGYLFFTLPFFAEFVRDQEISL